MDLVHCCNSNILVSEVTRDCVWIGLCFSSSVELNRRPKRRLPPPNGLNLSPAMEDYLKAISLLDGQSKIVATQALADRMKVSPPSVTNMVKRLAKAELIEYEPYRGVRLTRSGRDVAVEMVRHYRLLKLYLVQALGFRWDEVEDDAERLEHYISEKLEDRISAALGDPSFGADGSPIPTLEGEVPFSFPLCDAELEGN